MGDFRIQKTPRGIRSFISIQPLRPVRQEQEPGHGTDMALGTLHPRQVLGGKMPLLSPAYVPTFAATCLCVRSDARDPSSERWNFVGEKDVW